MLRPITDGEWAHIDDLLGSGPRPNVVGAWLWLTGRMEISRTTFESRLRVRRLTARSAGQAHAASAASNEEPDGAHGHACTAAQTPAPCPASEMPLSAVVREAQGFAPTEDDAGGGALGPELSTASELCEDDLPGQTEPPPESSGGCAAELSAEAATEPLRDETGTSTARGDEPCSAVEARLGEGAAELQSAEAMISEISGVSTVGDGLKAHEPEPADQATAATEWVAAGAHLAPPCTRRMARPEAASSAVLRPKAAAPLRQSRRA